MCSGNEESYSRQDERQRFVKIWSKLNDAKSWPAVIPPSVNDDGEYKHKNISIS